MKLHTLAFALVTIFCAACGVTPAADSSSGYTYVGGGGEAAPNASANRPASVVANSNITTTGGSGAATSTGGPATTGGTTSGTGTTTTGTTTSGSANTATTTGTATSGTTTSNTTAPTYTQDNLSTDMTTVLQGHTPIYSTQNLGNPANAALWTTAEIHSLYNGIVAAQAMNPSVSLQDFAHLILALGATDSTGDYRLGGGGYLQVSGSCTTDYGNHGQAISGPEGQILSPSSVNLGDPGTNVAIMLWYTRNATSAGESANEASAGLHDHVVTRDVGNELLAWLVGPGSDRHNLVGGSDAANRWPAFYNRILDYYFQAGFGSQASFDAILNSSVPSTLADFKDAPAGAFP